MNASKGKHSCAFQLYIEFVNEESKMKYRNSCTLLFSWKKWANRKIYPKTNGLCISIDNTKWHVFYVYVKETFQLRPIIQSKTWWRCPINEEPILHINGLFRLKSLQFQFDRKSIERIIYIRINSLKWNHKKLTHSFKNRTIKPIFPKHQPFDRERRSANWSISIQCNAWCVYAVLCIRLFALPVDLIDVMYAIPLAGGNN